MQSADTLSLLAEIAAVLLGFAGLTTAYQSSYKGKYLVNLQIGQRYLLMSSCLLLLGALLPLVLNHLGVGEPLLWQISVIAVASALLFMLLDGYRITGNIPGEAQKRLSRPALIFSRSTVFAQLALGLGCLFLPSIFPLEGGFILMLYLGFMATISIFAANVMPHRNRLLRSLEKSKE